MDEKFIELRKKYGDPRSPEFDEEFLRDNDTHINPYTIPTILRYRPPRAPVYTIDPESSTDADDAFSIYTLNDKLILAIHIADPTDYVSIDSKLWTDIKKRAVTSYPSNCPPYHMLPRDILDKSSLKIKDGLVSEHKKSVSIFVEIDKKKKLPIDETAELKFCTIELRKTPCNSYESAARYMSKTSNTIIHLGVKIAEAMESKRGGLSSVLNTDPVSVVRYKDGKPFMKKDTRTVHRVKNMIAQFAIYANSFVGRYLSKHLGDLGIYRTCDAEIIGDHTDSSANELMNAIVRNGVDADYRHTPSTHDIVGVEKYSHFTSPIRRASDMVVHYLLKYIFLENLNYFKNNIYKMSPPFTEIDLKDIANNCYEVSKMNRKINREEAKLRMIQLINDTKPVKVLVRFTSYIKERFLNCMITKIDNFDVSLSIVFKVTYSSVIPERVDRLMSTTISIVYPLEKFDAYIFPTLKESCISYFLLKKNKN